MNIDLCCEKIKGILKKAKVTSKTINEVLLTIKEFNDATSTALPRNESEYIFKIGPKKKNPNYRSIGAVSTGDSEVAIRSNKDK